MNKNNNSTRRWILSAVYLGVIALMMACAAFGGAQVNEDGTLQLDDGVVQVRDEDGNWVPVAGTATFELVGELESLDPWMVAGKTLETNELTQIEEGLKVGDLVYVEGAVLEDDTWVAYSIELAEQVTEPIIILIGVVDAIDPWKVNGIELNVTDETDIQGEITVGMIVRVEILLLDDGTWEVVSIAPLGESTDEAGCATIIATVVSVEGNQIQFLGWPTTVTLQVVTPTETAEANDNGEDDDENDDGEQGDEEQQTISAGDTVQAVICVSEDGAFVIVQITILNVEDEDGGESTGGEKVLVCHNASKNNPHTISIAAPAVPAHLAHGDTLGACP